MAILFTSLHCLTVSLHRNPEASLRPGFRDLLLALLENEEAVLTIPEDALATHAQAGVLGAPLEAGVDMYHAAQQAYVYTTSEL